MSKECIFRAPSLASQNAAYYEFLSSGTVWSVTATNCSKYFDGSKYWLRVIVSDANLGALLGAIDTGYYLRTLMAEGEEDLPGGKIRDIIEKLRGSFSEWHYPDFTHGAKADPGSWESAISASDTGGLITIDTDAPGANQDFTASNITSYGRRVLGIKPAEFTGACALIVELDYASAAQLDGITLGLALMDASDASGANQLMGWHDDSLSWMVKASGQTANLNQSETKGASDRLRFISVFDGNQDRLTSASVSFYGDDDDDAADQTKAATSEHAFDISSGCYLALLFGTRSPNASGDEAVTFHCRYKWIDLSGGPTG
jgi:hypothetical protein